MDKFYSKIIINDLDVSKKTKEEAINLVRETLNNEQNSISINLLCDDKSFNISGVDLNYKYDIENTINTAYACS